eukprot:g3796.t1
MDLVKMKHVLASRTRLAKEERALSRSLKAQQQAEVSARRDKMRRQTQFRREQQHANTSHHLGSKLALYSSAVTQANMARSSSRMRRVNRHPHPNPIAGPASAQPSAAAAMVAADGADSPPPRRPEPEPNIWGKLYALDQYEAEEKKRKADEKEAAAASEHVGILAKQVAERDARAAAAKAHEDKYARIEAAQRDKWRVEERRDAEAQRQKNAREKVMFEEGLRLTQARRDKERRAEIEQEAREVERIKRAQRAAEKRAAREKRRQKAVLDRFQEERIADDKVQAAVRARRKQEEIEAAQDAERMMDKMDADRQAMLDGQHEHQAYLYGKAESVQDKVRKELAAQEAQMLAAYEKQNRAEDERHRAKAAKRARAEREQKESIRQQLALQAAARRAEAEREFRLAHGAKVADEKAAFETMLKHVQKRQNDVQFRVALEGQCRADRQRKKAAQATMTELEERLNASRIRQAEEHWRRKMAADRRNPPAALPECIGVADLGMK